MSESAEPETLHAARLRPGWWALPVEAEGHPTWRQVCDVHHHYGAPPMLPPSVCVDYTDGTDDWLDPAEDVLVVREAAP